MTSDVSDLSDDDLRRMVVEVEALDGFGDGFCDDLTDEAVVCSTRTSSFATARGRRRPERTPTPAPSPTRSQPCVSEQPSAIAKRPTNCTVASDRRTRRTATE